MVKSKPVSWHVVGRLLATSKSQIPVPAPISAILAVGEGFGMLGWRRKPRVLVVKKCCSSSLWEKFSVDALLKGGYKACLSGISSTRGYGPDAASSSPVIMLVLCGDPREM